MRSAAARYAPALAVAAAVAALASCKREARHGAGAGTGAAAGPDRDRGPAPRLLFRRKLDGVDRPFLVPAQGGDPVAVLADLPGDFFSAAGLEGGDALFMIVRPKGQTLGDLWRIATQPALHPEQRLMSGIAQSVFAATPDGRTILLLDSKPNDNRILLLGPDGKLVEVAHFRQQFDAALSPDGRRLVLSGVLPSCTDSWIGKCPASLFTVDLTARPPVLHTLLDGGARVHYHPRFVPGTDFDISYQTTSRDPSPECDKGLNFCRHDLMQIDYAGAQPPRLLREGALGPYYSQRGDHSIYLGYLDREADCKQRLPCGMLSVYLAGGTQLADPKRIVSASVYMFAPRWWSPDGRWLAYLSSATPAAPENHLHVIDLDGKHDHVIDGDHPIGWIR